MGWESTSIARFLVPSPNCEGMSSSRYCASLSSCRQKSEATRTRSALLVWKNLAWS